ncbi:cation transporter [Rhizobium sullae]|uniref:cation transporter n=1 Tax=Rhizobium sullae TaxID=50338 RepID=UPI000B35C8B1|nr:cation transporter [Rhizobium sullae]
MESGLSDPRLRSNVLIVALLNFVFFGVEFAVALSIGSISLFADSIDFLKGASVSVLIAFALGWSMKARTRVGMGLAGILVLPALALLWALWSKFNNPIPPEPSTLWLTGAVGLIVNWSCAFLLGRFHSVSLARAALLFARADAVANVAIFLIGLVTAYVWQTVWPDVIVGLAIAVMNVDAGRAVWRAAHEEHEAAV